MSDTVDMIARVAYALGRKMPRIDPPTPPGRDEPLTRLVHADLGLPALFTKTATGNKIAVESLRIEDLADRTAAFLREKSAKNVGLTATPLLQRIGLIDELIARDINAMWWTEMTLDGTYDLDAGITDVYAAVAETGSIVIRPSPAHGRALSLVPPLHIAIVEPKNLLPDLVDLFDKIAADGVGSGISIITGPSKTSDIEMTLVTGVHGPHQVKVFLLE